MAYAPALWNGFVWDDQALILRDPLIRSWRLIGEGFTHFLFTDASASDFYRPLQRPSYTFDYAVFFLAPAGYHLVSILWHAAAAVALFFFAEEFLARFDLEPARRLPVAFLVAFVWLWHPVQNAAVIYVAGRADSMAAAFGFLALYLGLRMRGANGTEKWALGLGAGFCFLASALSKEIGLIFFLVWLIIVLAQRPRAALIRQRRHRRRSARRLPEFAPPGGTLSCAGASPAPLLVRPIVSARAVAEYAGLLSFPRLCTWNGMSRHTQTVSSASLNAASMRELQTFLGLLLIAAVVFALWRSRRHPAIFLPLLLAVVMLFADQRIDHAQRHGRRALALLPSAFLFLAATAALESFGWIAGKISVQGGACRPDDLVAFAARAYFRARL